MSSNSMYDFDLTPTIRSAKPVLHPRLGSRGLQVKQAPQTVLNQCAGYDPQTGLWRLTQAKWLGSGKGESQIMNVFSNTGDYLSRTVFHGAGHGSSWGLLPNNKLLIQYDKVDAKKYVTNRRVAQVGATTSGNISNQPPGAKFYDPTTGYLSPVTDLAHNKIGIRSSNGNTQIMRLYDMAPFLSGSFASKYEVRSDKKYRTFQGWASYGNTFWILYGNTDGNSVIEEFRWTERTGMFAVPMNTLNVTGLLKGMKRSSFEPEGLFVVVYNGLVTLTMGARFGPSGQRREFILWNVCSVNYNTSTTESATRLIQDLPIKSVSAEAVAKARTSGYVSRHVYVLQHWLRATGKYTLKIDGIMGPKTQAGFTAQAGGSYPSVAALTSIRAAAERKGSLGLFNKVVSK